MAGFSRMYGISRQAGYKWVQRFLEEGLAGLADRSPARPARTCLVRRRWSGGSVAQRQADLEAAYRVFRKSLQ